MQIFLMILNAVLTACTYSEQKDKVPTLGSNLSENRSPHSDKIWLQERLFQSKCGSCHTNSRAPGGYTFEDAQSIDVSMSKGAIKPGNYAESMLSQIIISGRMPPAGVEPRPTKTEIEILNCWIARGALDAESVCWQKFAKSPTTAPEAEPKPIPTEPPSVSNSEISDFEWLSTQLFRPSCGICHVGSAPPKGFELSTLNGFRDAINKGVTSGSHGTSLLSQVIMNGRMPPPAAGNPPSESSIKIFNCWIDNGALETGNACWKAGGSLPLTPPVPLPIPEDEISYRSLNVHVLIPKCIGCHAKGNAMSGVRVDTLSALLNPVDGPALVRCGKPEESLLYETVSDDEMPFDAPALNSNLKKLLFDWIKKECPL